MLEAQITQQASSSPTPPSRLMSKLESNPREHCNYVTLKEGEEDRRDLEDIPLEEGREMIVVESKERNDGGKRLTFIGHDSLEIPIVFPPKPSDSGGFSIPCVVGKMKIQRALYDLGASVSLMPYSLFHRLYLGSYLHSCHSS